MGIEADTITTAKALTSGYQPLSALLVGDRIAATLVEKGGEFFHGYTYSGHPVACAVALKNLEIIEREGMIERVRTDTGPYFAEALRERIAGHPLVGEVRTFGLLGAIEIVKDKATQGALFAGRHRRRCVVRDHAIANGMMLRATGDTMILSPPLIWTRADDRPRLRAHRQGARPCRGRASSQAVIAKQYGWRRRHPHCWIDRRISGFAESVERSYLGADSLVALRTLISSFSLQ